MHGHLEVMESIADVNIAEDVTQDERVQINTLRNVRTSFILPSWAYELFHLRLHALDTLPTHAEDCYISMYMSHVSHVYF